MTPAATVRYWPTWGPHAAVIDGGRVIPPYAALARYVSREAVDGLPQLKVRRPSSADPKQRDRALAQSLYSALAGLGLSYALDPRTPLGPGRQQVRHPAWLLGDKVGTCLDLATTYASMCLDHHLMPLLVVGNGHAVVAVALGADVSDEKLPGCVAETPGVLRVEDLDVFEAAVGDSVLAVECTDATTRLDTDGNPLPPTSFARAEQDGVKEMLRSGMRIIDVAWLHEPGPHQVHPLAPPDDWLDVRLFLPGGISQEQLFGSQQALFMQLKEAHGIHVIHAPSGQGKSTIARRLVGETPFGAGWFLNASDRQVLVNSLAAAELAQVNRTGVGLADVDRAGHADGARTRLRDARHPWLVAIDNADGESDPIYRTLPTPKGDQLVVITTTNEDWAENQDVAFHALEPLTEEEVLRELGNPELVGLVGGRALMVNGFKRAATALNVSTSELEVSVPQVENEELAGPIAFWSMLVNHIPEAVRRVAQTAAFLPPDNVRISALEALELSSQAPAALAIAGVLDHAEGSEFARLHRLYGKAIQSQLLDGEPSEVADNVVSLVTRNPETARVLGEFGDGTLIERLLELLEDGNKRITPPVRYLGESFAAVGAMLELRNQVVTSAKSYERALDHLDEEVPEDRAIVAGCVHGIVRPQYQHNSKEAPLRAALAQQVHAHELMKRAGLEAKAGKFLGLRGNIETKLSEFAGDQDDVVAALRAALAMVDEANRLRLRDNSTPPEELARSQFNLAGPRIRLSQMEPEQAAEHLGAAEQVYREVLEQRQRIYAAHVHGHIAACVAGLGLVDYLRALIVASGPPQRTALLRTATSHTLESARQREALAGLVDDGDVGKSYRLLTKISMARHLESKPWDERRGEHRKLIREALRELRGTGDLIPPA